MRDWSKRGQETRDSRYHNTSLLLRKYRSVTWSLEVSVSQSKKAFEREFGQSIEEFLDSVYLAGFELGGHQLENRAKEMQKSYDMLRLIDSAVEIIRTKHTNGEQYYWLLYYTYLSPQRYSTEQILSLLQPHMRDLTRTTYYRRREQAVELVGSVLWGYADNATRTILDEFLSQYGEEGRS